MPIDKENYKSTLKNTTLFGGVQVFNILISIVRTKVVAVLIGPIGMGIVGLYDSALSMIATLTSMGLGTSAVKDISEANHIADVRKVSEILVAFRKLVWFTGLFGAFFCLLFSSLLSELTFGNSDYTIGFVLLSISLLFRQLTSGQTAMFQGLHKYKYMAEANVIGNLLGLCVSVSLYYIWGINAIVPVLILISIIPFVMTSYYAQKVKIEKVHMPMRKALTLGRGMVIMGFMVSFGYLLSLVASYIIRVFIGHYGGISDVGLYTAGFAIVNGYVGMVFNAMGTDYYPRLAAVNTEHEKMVDVVNSQIEISILIIGPIVAVFIIFIKEIVLLFYSAKFIAVGGMIYWAIFGMFFKAVSWCLAFVLLSKGDAKIFAVNETIANIYMMVLNVVSYMFYGLTGLGISFLLSYALYMVQMLIVVKKKYQITLRFVVVSPFLIHFMVGLMCVYVTHVSMPILKYLIGSLLCLVLAAYSVSVLNQRIGLMSLLKSKISK